MRIQTLTLVAGTSACNADCPFCVSRMTGDELHTVKGMINLPKLHKAFRLAKLCSSTTALITGKGEPTLYPDDISEYTRQATEYGMPIIELQTNGFLLMDLYGKMILNRWRELGLDTIAVSVVHWLPDINRRLISPNTGEYVDLGHVINLLHACGFMVRLTCTMTRGCVDTPDSVMCAIREFAKLGADQASFTPVRAPLASESESVKEWVDAHSVPDGLVSKIELMLEQMGHKLLTLPHGASIFDVDGMSVCVRDCLTIKPETDEVRQLIFFPDGRVMYDWQYKGARLL